MRIIDAHVHMGPYLPPGTGETVLDATTGDSLVAIMDAHGIERCCAFAPLVMGQDHVDLNYRVANRAIHEAAKAHPDRIIGYARVNPNGFTDATEELIRCRDEYGFRGLKLHPDWEYHTIDSPHIEPYLALCESWGWPVFFHTGYYPLSQPALMLPVARKFPRLTIIMAHLSYAHTTDAITIANLCPNVYLETSGNATATGIQEVIRRCGAGKLIFGSDLPYTFPDHVTGKILAQPDLSDDDRAAILGGTMLRLLNLA